MKKMINERQAYMEEMPSDLEVLRELEKREALNESYSKKLRLLEAKNKGINQVFKYLEKYGKGHWIYARDVAMDYYNIITCDLLVMTSTHVYTLEINHYDGTFEFENGMSKLDGEILAAHPIPMAQSALSQIQHLKRIAPFPIDLKLKSAAVFTNSNHFLKIHDEVKDIEIVAANQLEQFVQQMVREERPAQKLGAAFNPLYWSWVMNIDRHHPYIPLEIPEDILATARPGITCSYCSSFNVKIGEVLMACACGGWEFAEEAIVRTIWDYSTLNSGKALHPSLIKEFFNQQVPDEQLDKVFEKLASAAG